MPIEISDYDPEWPNQFLRIRAGIRGLFDENEVGCWHIGSTAQEGWAARPIIDIASSGVRSAANEVEKRLLGVGYMPLKKQTLGAITALASPEGSEFPHHIYVCPLDAQERHVLFRFPGVLHDVELGYDRYLQLKHALAATIDDPQEYWLGKSGFIRGSTLQSSLKQIASRTEWLRKGEEFGAVRNALRDAGVDFNDAFFVDGWDEQVQDMFGYIVNRSRRVFVFEVVWGREESRLMGWQEITDSWDGPRYKKKPGEVYTDYEFRQGASASFPEGIRDCMDLLDAGMDPDPRPEDHNPIQRG